MTISDINSPEQPRLFRDLWNGSVISKYLVAEYWTFLPVRDKAYLLIERLDRPEKNQNILSAAGWVQRSDLLRRVRHLSDARWLHTLTLVLANDSDLHAASSLLHDFTKLGQKKDFTVLSLTVPRTTSEIVAGFPAHSVAA
jgi:hypothetical protein